MPFENIHFSIGEISPSDVQRRLKGVTRTLDATAPAAETAFAREMSASLSSASDETAARSFLQTYLEDSGKRSLVEITAPSRPELVPDMHVRSVTPAERLDANTVVFQQTSQSIPIFGSRVVVDVNVGDKTLVAINGKVTPVPNQDPFAKISANDALHKLTAWGDVTQSDLPNVGKAIEPPVLTWFLDEETDKWHLVYHFSSVPMVPRAEEALQETNPFPEVAHFCLGCSPRSEAAIYDYFVDAQSGEVVFYYSSTPHLDIPSPMRGVDSNGKPQNIWGLGATGYFSLIDPIRNIETYDYQNNNLAAQPPPVFPSDAIRNPTNDFGNGNPAAVSAHYHATVVFDFYNNVLTRKGVDNKGMKLVSVINVYQSDRNPLPAPQWGNAVWWNGKMWYGQKNGVSYAKYLDVIAHELTHGVTQSSSNLIYRRVSGALNESYSDIFGVVIANWYPAAPQPLRGWTWEIGAGLGRGGGPIRHFADPQRAGQPDHWSQYRVLPLQTDQGGVHIYSGIHNKAIYKLLTGTDDQGTLTFPTQEAVMLLYWTLIRLTPTSDFADSRRTLESVTRTYYASDPATMNVRLNAIAAAFQAVGL